MKKILLIPFLFFSLAAMGACSADEKTSDPETPDQPAGNSNILVAYFSATGNTQRVAERIAALTGADVYRIEAADLPAAETIARYDTIFVGSPCWWHQPAMVVCTFLEAYDLSGKTIVPFFTYGATTYLNESMQKIYRLTPESKHIPATLPEDLDPDDITTPGRPDDAGIDMPGSAGGVEAWLKRIGI